MKPDAVLDDEYSLNNLFAAGSSTAAPYTEEVNIDGQYLTFIIDTAAATVISERTNYAYLSDKHKLKPCSTVLMVIQEEKYH